MDVRALGEALLAVAITPLASIGLAILVVAPIAYLAVRVARAEDAPRTAGRHDDDRGIEPDAEAT